MRLVDKAKNHHSNDAALRPREPTSLSLSLSLFPLFWRSLLVVGVGHVQVTFQGFLHANYIYASLR